MQTLRYRSQRQRGTAAVEAALTLIPLVVILMAVMEGGWFMYFQTTLTHAAREGVTMAVRPHTKTNDLGTIDEVRDYVAPFLSAIGVNCPTCITITQTTPNVCSETPGCTGSTDPQPLRTMLKVRVEVPYNSITLSMFKLSQFTLRGEASMRAETSAY